MEDGGGTEGSPRDHKTWKSYGLHLISMLTNIWASPGKYPLAGMDGEMGPGPAHYQREFWYTVIEWSCLDMPAAESCTAVSGLHVTVTSVLCISYPSVCGEGFSHTESGAWIQGELCSSHSLDSCDELGDSEGRYSCKGGPKFQCLASGTKYASAHWVHGQHPQRTASPQQSPIFAKCSEIFQGKVF